MKAAAMVEAQSARDLRRLAAALLIPLVAFAVQWVFWPAIAPYVWFLFFPAVFLSSWIDGRRGGLAATVLSAGIVWFFFIPPQSSFVLERPMSLVSIAVFVVMGVLFSVSHERLRTANRRTAAALESARQANEALRSASRVRLERSEQLLRLFVEHAPAAIAMFDRNMRYLAVSRRFLRDYGVGDRDLTGLLHYDVFPELSEEMRAIHRRCLAGAVESSDETPFPRADGSVDWVRWEMRPWREADGTIGGVILFSEVLTERKRVEQQVAESGRLLRQVIDLVPHHLFAKSREGRFLFANAASARSCGRSPEEMVGHLERELRDDLDHTELFLRDDREVIDSGQTKYIPEERIRYPDGSEHILQTTKMPFVPPGQTERAVLGVAIDLTELRRAQGDLQRSEARFEQMAAHIEDVLYRVDGLTGEFDYVSPAFERMFGYTLQDVERMGGRDAFLAAVIEGGEFAEQSRGFAALQRGADGHMPARWQAWWRCRDGSLKFIEDRWIPAYADGRLRSTSGILRDETQRRQAEEALRESEGRFRQLAENIDAVFWISDAAMTEILYVSPAYQRIWGRDPSGLNARPLAFAEAIHPDDRARIVALLRDKLVEHGDPIAAEYRIVRPDGTVRWIRDRGFPVRDGSGHIVRMAGIAEDITREHDLQEQIRHAQKMEAVGELAGGVAHDFNNMLHALLGYCDIVRAQLPPEHASQSDLLEIRRIGDRAAALTRQLLAFGRKQNLDRRVTDMNALVVEVGRMLGRVIGENIQLVFDLPVTTERVFADGGQIGQILMNLALNARDAMPQGGRLSFQTRTRPFSAEELAAQPDVRPGLFVCVAVTDTGCGMAPDVLARIFQPFFTTKALGKGTGLGLATSYGIARQHDGWIAAESEPGKGTTFHLCLPAMEREAAPVDATPGGQTRPATAGGKGQRILFVEDEESIRFIIRRQLEAGGYVAVTAADGASALAAFESAHGGFDLVLTDMVLPDTTGIELLEKLLERKPGLHVLVSSGYTDNERRWPIIRARRWPFLAKPYTAAELLETVGAIFQPKPGA